MRVSLRGLLGVTVVFLALVLSGWSALPVHAAPTLGDATTKTTLGNDVIGGSKFIYSLGGISISTTTTSTDGIVLGAGSIRFSDGSTQSTSAQTTLNYWALSGVNLYPTSTSYKAVIGGTVATSSLTVIGDAILYGASGNISAGVYYDRTNTAYYLDPGANENAYSLTVAGSVGIGTTGPNKLLSLSATNPTIQILSTDGNDATIQLGESVDGSGDINRGFRIVHDGGDNKFYIDKANNDAYANVITLDRATGNVGIGTSTAPVGKLSVVGGYLGVGQLVQLQTYLNDNEVNFGYNQNANYTGYINYRGYNGGTTQFRDLWIGDGKNNAVMFVDGSTGNVGIGTTSPGYPLDVLRTSGADYAVRIQNTASASSAWGLRINAGTNSNDGALDIRNSTASQSFLFVRGDGNVGIATTTPSDELTVFGDIRISKSGSALIFPDGTTQTTAAVGGGGYWSLSGTNLYPTSTSYKAVIGGTVATSSLTVIGDAILYGASGNISAGVYYDRTNTAYYLDPGANENAYSLTVAGSVGIADTSPLSLLTVGAQGENANYAVGIGQSEKNGIYVNSSDYGLYSEKRIYVADATNLSEFLSGIKVGTTPATDGKFRLPYASNIQFRNQANNANYVALSVGTFADDGFLEVGENTDLNGIKFYPGSAVAMTILKTSGNVGIGTTTPATKLDVAGSITSRNQLAINYGGGTTAIANIGAMDDIGSGLPTGTDLLIKSRVAGSGIGFEPNNGNTATLYLKSDGNVGIGTTNPTAKLEVAGTVSSTAIRFPDGTTQTTAGGGVTNYWSLSGVNLYPTSTTYKVAIGSAAATSSLSVVGDGTFYGASGNISAGVYYDRTNTAYYLDPGANENAYSLTVAGNVGIATTTPGHALTIAGAYYSKMVELGNRSGNVTIDWNSGNTQHMVLTGNATTSFTNGKSGGRYTLVIKQDGTGARTMTWPSSVRWSGPAPALSTAANATDYIGFIYNGVDAKYDGVAINTGF